MVKSPITEAHLEPFQTSKMELFAKIVNGCSMFDRVLKKLLTMLILSKIALKYSPNVMRSSRISPGCCEIWFETLCYKILADDVQVSILFH